MALSVFGASAHAMGKRQNIPPTSPDPLFRFRTEYTAPENSMKCEIQFHGVFWGGGNNRTADLRCENEFDHARRFEVDGLPVPADEVQINALRLTIGNDMCEAVGPGDAENLAKVQSAFSQMMDLKGISLGLAPEVEVIGFSFKVIVRDQDSMLFNQRWVDHHWGRGNTFLDVYGRRSSGVCIGGGWDSRLTEPADRLLASKFRVRGAVQLQQRQ